MTSYIIKSQSCVLITDRIRRMAEGNVFSLFTPGGRGYLPWPGGTYLGQGYLPWLGGYLPWPGGTPR